MKTLRSILKTCLAVICIGVLALSLNSSEIRAESGFSAEARYTGGSSIAEIMSKYIYFVEGDLTGTTTAHTSGAIVVGGSLNYAVSGFGNLMTSPSYIHHINGLNYINSIFPGTEGCQGERIVYYGTADAGIPGYLFYNPAGGNGSESILFQNPDYMSVPTIMAAVRQESSKLAAAGDAAAYQIENGVLTIDFEKAASVSISEDLSQIQRIELKNVTIEELMTKTHVISLTGRGTVNLNAQSITVEGSTIDQKFKDYAINRDAGSASTGGQYYLGGLNLVWNIPNAGAVSFVNLNGQLVAPNAEVSLMGGRHEGCVIAASVTTDSEAHFYPIGELKEEPTPEEEPTTEAPTTEEKSTTEQPTTEEKLTTEGITTTEGKSTSEESGSTSDREILESRKQTSSTGVAATTERKETAVTAVPTGDATGIAWISGLALIALGGGVWFLKKR